MDGRHEACARVVRADAGFRDSGLVDGLTDEEAERVTGIAIRRRFTRGHALFRAGDRLRYLYIVSAGRVKTSTRALDGRERVMSLAQAGAIVGLESLGGEPTTVEASMLVDGEVLLLPIRGLESLSADNARLQRNLHRIVSHTIVHDYEVIRLLARADVEARVAAFLLSLADDRSGGDPAEAALEPAGPKGPVVVQLPASRGEIASLLGMRSETFSRVLSNLRGHGLLRSQRGGTGIELTDRAALGGMCGLRLQRGAMVRAGVRSA